LDPSQSFELTRDINVKSEVLKNNTCLMQLKNNIGAVVDSFVMNFTTTEL